MTLKKGRRKYISKIIYLKNKMTYNLEQEDNKDASGHNYYERITRLDKQICS